jgi:putative ABC transport system ATP-binding protein
MSANSIFVQARDVRHAFGEGDLRKEVLHGISCEIHSREMVIITGPSGSGKTTFLTLIGALRGLQTGSVTLLGQELRGAKSERLVEARRAIGFIFQQHNLLPAFTARENVQLALAVDPGLSTRKCRTRAMELLSAVGMSDHAYKRPAQLSGGQRQRVAIARALVRRPRVILADEPTASLDRVTGREIVDLLQGLAREEGCALILITHDLRILSIADRLLHLEDGILTGGNLGKESAEAES